jgi:hypothetical protein
MAHTFVIRFGKSAGLAGLLETPANSFRWKGSGSLSIDAQGLSIAVKRGFASLLARRRSQRIPADSIREVYREGDALRIDFATEDNPRAVLPFWARNRETAAQIVQLLPTLRTFEVEHGASESRESKARRVPWIGPVAVVLVVAAGILFVSRKRPAVDAATAQGVRPAQVATPVTAAPEAAATIAPSQTTDSSRAEPLATGRLITPDEARKLAMLAEDPVDWTSPPPRSITAASARQERFARLLETLPTAESEVEAFVPMDVPEIRSRGNETVVPVPQTTLAYDTARELLRVFEVEAAELTGAYRRERERFERGDLATPTFADRLDGYELRWRNVIERVLQDRKFSDPALTGMRATLLSVVIQQRVFLTGYAAGLRAGDQGRIDRAFEELARAEQGLARARQYLN